ncbi:hypothetical protein [Brevibacillus invocatus]|nr:hypothetical protein [Brevibacillus invocatus]MCM3081914.1 hypothetical protein [Brevibacillus invocatus]MCM3082197.1 hypothetical protein [Brevibacillus invocatus]MCM3432320.1 hypothetical protein [Brevibacillus invocatus]MCM3432633.1 hypothetical protein [Brevibacillus invocatus]
MIVKWAIGGAVVGAIFWMFNDIDFMVSVFFGGALGVIIRKWLFRTFWQ